MFGTFIIFFIEKILAKMTVGIGVPFFAQPFALGNPI